MVELTGQKFLVDVGREQRKRDDSDTVLQDRDRKHRENEDQLGPATPQESITSEQTGEQQTDARPNAAALVGNLDREFWQREKKVVTVVWSACQVEESRDRFG
jgi:hypothetical protein